MKFDFKKLQYIPDGSKPWGKFTLMLLTKEQLLDLPDGVIVVDIFGIPCVKFGGIDTDTREGYTAFGFLRAEEENDETAPESVPRETLGS